MNKHDATEVAFRNGRSHGSVETARKIVTALKERLFDKRASTCIDDQPLVHLTIEEIEEIIEGIIKVQAEN